MRSTNIHLIALLGAFVVLAVLWSFLIPIGEAPDELDHWAVLRYIHQQHSLPVYNHGMAQSLQMPLYYLLVAPLAADCPSPAFTGLHDAQGITISSEPPKMYRNFKDDLFRYRPFRVVRFASILFSALAVWLCFCTALVLTGRRSTALLAGSIAAFLPQFTFRAATISNDQLAVFFAAAAVYFMVRILKLGYSNRDNLLGVFALALGYITKAHLSCLLVPWILTIVLMPAEPRERRRRLSFLAFWVLIACVPLVRNWILVGDPFLVSTVSSIGPPVYAPRSLFSLYFLTLYPYVLIQSFIANFAHMNFLAPPYVYRIFFLLALLAIAGLIVGWRGRRIDRRIALVLAVTFAANYAFIVWVNLTFSQPQGRYLFPSLTALAILAAVGLESLPGWRPAAGIVCAAFFCALNLHLLRTVIAPAFWTFPAVNQEAIEKPIGRIAGAASVVQTFVCPCAGLNRIDLFIGTYVMRNGGHLNLTVAEPGAPEPLTRAAIASSSIRDNSWVTFTFWPLDTVPGRPLQLQLTSPDAPPGEGVAIYTAAVQPKGGGQLLVNNAPVPGAAAFRAYCSGDWGGGFLLKALQMLIWKLL